MAKLVKSKGKTVSKPSKAVETKATKSKTAKVVTAKAAKAKPVVAAPLENESKKINQKLLETLEKRKAAAAQGKPGGSSFGGRPGRRRGRRPKNVDYTPTHTEEDSFSGEPEYEGLEYDTGIRVNRGGEDGGMSLDRLEDFDEELNFDW